MRRIGVLGAVTGSVVAMTFVGGAAQAHPPNNPYDNTIFAPVRTGGVRIGLETVARGLTAPVKVLPYLDIETDCSWSTRPAGCSAWI
jgi:hypothetical protein